MSTGHKLALPEGCLINQYRIEAVLGYGGFGIVYQAVHQQLGHLVAIKEYLPQELSVRDGTRVQPLSTREAENYQFGKQRFLSEAKELVQFRHPNIVRCSDFIEANGTAYLVMDYEDGLPLNALLTLREKAGNPLTEAEVRQVIMPLLDGLAAVHAHDVLHRDIKPSNIFIRRSTEEPVLIDFGAAKQGFSEHSKSMAPFTEGYAAMEQVERAGNLGPWTDIYALGALMWRIVAGANPPAVENRSFALLRGNPDPLQPALEVAAGSYSGALLNAIDRCLAIKELDRFQTVEELQEALLAEPPSAQPRQTRHAKRAAAKAAEAADKKAIAKPAPRKRAPRTTTAKATAKATKSAEAKPAAKTAAAKATAAPKPATRTVAKSATAKTSARKRAAAKTAAPSAAKAPGNRRRPAKPVPLEEAAPQRGLRDLAPFILRLPPMLLQGLDAGMKFFVRASASVSLVVFLATASSEWLLGDLTGLKGGPTEWPQFQQATKDRWRLRVNTVPRRARVRIMNIKPRYRRAGILLNPGSYRVEVSARGYETQELTVPLGRRDLTLEVELVLAKVPGVIFRDRYLDGDAAPELVVLPAGSFQMGDLSEPRLGRVNERPLREVVIPRPIAIMRYEVTRGDFRRFAERSGYVTEAERGTAESLGCRVPSPGEGRALDWSFQKGRNWRNAALYGMTQATDRHPVICVSWNDAQAYAAWLSGQTGQRYRLPSEAEWEYAARAGTETPWSYGSRRQCRYANGADETRLPNRQFFAGQRADCTDRYAFTAQVGSLDPNPFDLHDMHGNIREWVQDCYHSSYSEAPTGGEAREECDSDNRVQRGGAWFNSPSWLRSASRSSFKPSLSHAGTGFRLVQDLDPNQ